MLYSLSDDEPRISKWKGKREKWQAKMVSLDINKKSKLSKVKNSIKFCRLPCPQIK